MPARPTNLGLSIPQNDPSFCGLGCARGCPRPAGLWPIQQTGGGDELWIWLLGRIWLEIIDQLSLHNITLVVQDWGGLLGLTLPMDRPDRISRLLVMNTTLAIGHSTGKGFDQWRACCQARPDLNISRLMQRTCPNLTLPEAQTYDAPFPDASYKAGVRLFPIW